MSDHQTPSVPPVDSQTNVNEGPPVKRPCMNDTPPIALTPGDDGSDFYNTPVGTSTPAVHPEVKSETVQNDTKEPALSQSPAPVIPGLNLVYENPNDQKPSQSTAPGNEAGGEPQDKVQEQQNTAAEQAQTTQPAQGLTAESNDAMQVDETNVSDDQNGGMTAAENAATANAAEQAQGEQEEEEEEHPEWEIDSSPYESSSDSSTSSDDSDDDDEDYEILSPEEQARILMQAELGSDDEGDGKGKSGNVIKSTNELPEEAPPIPEAKITPEMKIVLLGHVEAVVENTILIAANTSGEYQVLESGSLLCHEDRTVAGVVAETLGRVENPLYAVRYPSAAAVEERGITVGKNLYYVEEQSTFVFTQPLKGLKGSDASNFHDEEVGEEEAEFSDDEAEAEYKRKLKQKRQERKDAKHEGGASKSRRGPPGPSKLGQSELNYDDNAMEDGYTPLARPKNLHEMMGRQEAPVESDAPSTRGGGGGGGFRGGRGRGRGSDRGRGRGRGGGMRDSQDRHSYRPQQESTTPQPTNYSPQPYPTNQQNPYGMPQQVPFAAFQQPQQAPQQAPFAQAGLPAPFNFQMPPFPQAYQQQNPYQQMPHINPLFLAALQQQQQQQQQQQYQQVPQQPGNQQAPNPTMNFDQVKAQLELLRQLSNGNQGPPPS